MQIKNGDTVLVRVKVRNVDETPIRAVDGVGDTIYIERSDIVSVEPRALRVGDRVTWGDKGLVGTIEMISDSTGEACVRVTGLNGSNSPCPCANHFVKLDLGAFIRA